MDGYSTLCCNLIALFFWVSAPASEDDPRAALRRLMDVVAAGNVEGVEALCAVEAPEQRPAVEAMARMLIAGRALADAATRRFGQASIEIGVNPIPADEAAVARSTVSIDGDTAELLMPGHTAPLRFIRQDGTWKLRVLAPAKEPERQPWERVALLNLFTSALQEATAEIEHDRYANTGDAEAAIRQKLNMVLMRRLAPATRPTTAPS